MKACGKSEGIFMIKFSGELVKSYKATHLTWRLLDHIVIVLCFYCHGRILGEMLLGSAFFFCVALKLIRSCDENRMLKARTQQARSGSSKFKALNLVNSILTLFKGKRLTTFKAQ